MNSIVLVFAAALAFCAAAPSGVLLSGPSGIVTGAGPIGPLGLGLGHGVVGLGLNGVGLGLGNVGLINGVGLGGLGLGLGGVGLGGVGLGHGGVVVKGPPTAPAAIIGPGRTGKIVADGLWGPTNIVGHGVLGHGGIW